MYLSRNLKYLRKKAGLSQDFIAQKFGYKSFTTIQKWETGISEPSFSTVNELCILYGVNLEDIIYKDLSSENIIEKEKNNTITKNEEMLLNKYSKLNDLGQKEAIKRVSELTEIDKYTRVNITTMAAHNDDNSEEQQELMMKDFEEMDKW